MEDRRHGSTETLQACLAIDLVVAWRILRLTRLGCSVADVSCAIFFGQEEWKALDIHHGDDPHPPATLTKP